MSFDEADYAAAAAPILADLSAAGLPTEGFGTFVSRKGAALFGVPPFDHERAVPILLAWLPRVTNVRVKANVAWHLATKHARPIAARPLMDEYRRAERNGPSARWALANAIAVTADATMRRELIELACDARHGAARTPFFERLGSARRGSDIVDALVSQLGDEEVTRVAVSALRRHIGAEALRPRLVVLAEHRSERVRAIATDELRRLDRHLAKRAAR